MRRLERAIVPCFAFGLALASCGFEVVGTAPPSSASPDARDGSSETGSTREPPPVLDTCPPLEDGWSPVAYAESRDASCPADHVSTDLVVRPPDDALCACTCAISTTDPPSCARGTLSGRTGTGCNGSSSSHEIDGTSCMDLGSGNYVVGGFGRFNVLPLSKGTCSSSVARNEAAARAVRACGPPASASTDVCVGKTPPGLLGCIAHDGDVGCPGGPFTVKTLVAASLSFECGGCATCENTATCPATATYRYYDDSSCETEVATRIIDGACNGVATGEAGDDITHFRYDAVPTNVSCTSSAPTVSATSEGPRTICCR